MSPSRGPGGLAVQRGIDPVEGPVPGIDGLRPPPVSGGLRLVS